ncbi:hypothetical protein J3459_010332 [Metarhizium acridum]|nr:hypothetical protein J3459_010332 [Metarhizium acridum]
MAIATPSTGPPSGECFFLQETLARLNNRFFDRSHEISCELNPDQNRGECDSKAGVAVGSSSYMSQGKDAIPPYKDMVAPLVVTAGADKLSPAPGATQTGNVPAATGSAGASRASLATRSGSTSASTTSATAANAAGAMVPRNLGPAGVAAATGGAMLLL